VKRGYPDGPHETFEWCREVIYTGRCEDLGLYYTDDTSLLEVRKTYTIEKEEWDSWHTKVFIKGFQGSFNPLHYEIINPTIKGD